ncbi:MAG: hypothetical protein JNM90_08235 [Burkholderiales bacterium]|nr:hypothetical protein [Burkholderiales bacterium]
MVSVPPPARSPRAAPHGAPARHEASLDEERFDDRVALFDAQGCIYEALSREDRDLGLPASIMGCSAHGMVQDRVAMLAKGVLTCRRDRLLRQVGNLRVRRAGELLRIDAGLVVYRSDEEGVSSLYMVARYEVDVADDGARLAIRHMAVVVDSFGIDTMLAVPL